MLYLDYAKQTEDGYIMNFFANSVEDLEDISEGKEFVTKNGTNYGVPAPQSVVTITNKDGEKTTYLMGEDGNWIPGVVNPTDYYTKKQADEKFAGKEEVETISQYVSTLDGEVIKLKTGKQDKITATTDIKAQYIDCNSITVTGNTNVRTLQIGVDGASTGNAFTYIFYDEAVGGATGSISLCTPTGARPEEDHADIYLPNITSGGCTLATTDDVAELAQKAITGVTIINSDAEEVETVSKLFYGSTYNDPRIVPGNWLEVPLPKTKTLFGNQSITGTGNIDLYKHHINLVGRPTGDFYIDVISSKKLVVGSLADLKTLLGDTFKISAYGDYNSLPVLYMSESTLYYLENGSINSIELSTPKLFYTDTVTTI